jgi:DNA repair exonuclease SbcCD ATPase subunit
MMFLKSLNKYFTGMERIDVPEEISKDVETLEEKEMKSDWVKEYLERIDKKIEVKRRLEKKIFDLEEERRVSEEQLKMIEDYEKGNFQYYLPYIDKKTGKMVPVASPYYDEKRKLEKKIESIKTELKTLKERISELTRGM